MQIGAVIVAAGMSSRMGDFKPMMNIGSISIAQRIVATLHQAGVERIIVVTGYNAQQLERHLAGNGLIFLRNEAYASTQMFDSAKIGLSYLRDKCDQILFTPVDIPLFTALTVTKLLESAAPLACPVCEGKTGHPLLISSSLLDTILSDRGENGLQGAISRCGVTMTQVPVEDPGVLHDADTPEDYQSLLAYHNEQLIRPELSISLSRRRLKKKKKPRCSSLWLRRRARCAAPVSGCRFPIPADGTSSVPWNPSSIFRFWSAARAGRAAAKAG